MDDTEEATTTTKKKATTTTTTTTTTTKKEEPKTTTTTAEAPVKTWSMTIYSGKDCDADDGDYIVVEGHTTGWSDCIDLSSKFNTEMSDTKSSCMLYTDGGFNWTSCEDSGMSKPDSYYLQKGTCYVYSDSECQTFNGAVNYYPKGCQDKYTHASSPDTFGSVSCSNAV